MRESGCLSGRPSWRGAVMDGEGASGGPAAAVDSPHRMIQAVRPLKDPHRRSSYADLLCVNLQCADLPCEAVLCVNCLAVTCFLLAGLCEPVMCGFT